MSLDSTLLLAVFFFLIGAAVMGLIWYLQNLASGNYRKGQQAEKPDPNLAEVARLMRDKTTQNLVVGINSHSFHLAKELNPGQLRRLHFASKVLAKWLEDTPPTPLTEEEQAAAQAEPASADPDQGLALPKEEEWIPAESVSAEPRADFIPPFITEPVSEVKPVSTQITDVVGSILKPAPSPAVMPENKSIAMQIDEILQQMIVGTPFEKRGISVNDAPDHGVMVTLDGEKYPGVKDVPDEEVRNLIRSAVVEWEKAGKFSPR